MLLECDKIEKEKRLKCVSENRRENSEVVRNVVLKWGRETLEIAVSEVIK